MRCALWRLLQHTNHCTFICDDKDHSTLVHGDPDHNNSICDDTQLFSGLIPVHQPHWLRSCLRDQPAFNDLPTAWIRRAVRYNQAHVTLLLMTSKRERKTIMARSLRHMNILRAVAYLKTLNNKQLERCEVWVAERRWIFEFWWCLNLFFSRLSNLLTWFN